MAISVTNPGDVDSKFARDAWLRALAKTATIAEQGVTLPELIARLSLEFDGAPALASAESAMTYGQLGSRCNQYSRWGISRGLTGGDAVSLLMSNCAEYLAIWLGLTRSGVVVALVNSQLAGDVLARSIKITDPKYLIVGADLAFRIAEIQPRLPASVACRGDLASRVADINPRSRARGACRAAGPSRDCEPLEAELASLSGEPLA